MKITVIKNKSNLVSRILGEQTVETNKYRLINYLVILKEKDLVLILNTLTGELLEIDSEAYALITGTVDYCSDLSYFVQNWFLVPIDFSESELLESVRNISESLDTQDYYNHYTIFTTTDCNARCFYCFENGKKRENMPIETAIKVADFVARHSFGKSVVLKWFGGEPLCNPQVIDEICSSLNSNNVNFHSTMVTNGYLIDDDFIFKAKNIYNLKHIQVTLDGTENVYNKTKAFVNVNCSSPFQQVLKNIKTVLLAGIRVNIRLNMDNHNYNDLFSLIDYLSVYFDTVKPYIYIAPLYDRKRFGKGTRSEIEHIEIVNKVIELEHYVNEKGFKALGRIKENIKTNACIADSKHSLVILPNGNVGKCDQHLDDMLIGKIDSDVFNENVIREWQLKRISIPMCNVCPVAPYCMKLANCPADNVADCLDIDREYLILKTKNKMRNEKSYYMENRN